MMTSTRTSRKHSPSYRRSTSRASHGTPRSTSSTPRLSSNNSTPRARSITRRSDTRQHRRATSMDRATQSTQYAKKRLEPSLKDSPHMNTRRLRQSEASSDNGSSSSSSPKNRYAASDSGRSSQNRHRSHSPSETNTSLNRQNSSDNKYNSVKKVIEVLNNAISTDKRIVAITNACAEFDHWDEAKHNAELHYGAADVLTLYLSMTEDDDEIRLVCAALEMVFRSSALHVKAAFHKVGSTIVPLLLKLLHDCENGGIQHADVIILNITKVLLIFSRVPDLRTFLARHQGLLDCLQRVATSNLNTDSRILRMRLFANLANCDANKVVILEYPNLLESLLRIAALDTSESAREYAGLSLMDLASEPRNQEPMAKIDKLLGTLVKLAILENIPDTRESAVTALQNLAFCKQNRVRLVSYGSGVVLEALKKTLASDKDNKARRRAAGALTNMACEETGERMGSHKGLLDTLALVTCQDESAEVRQRAGLALTKIASSVTCSMACHKNVLDALVVAADSEQAVSSVVAVMRVKARDPVYRESMAFHPGILDTLADVTVNKTLPTKDRDNAMRAIMHLTNEPNNCKVMCCKKILNALVIGVSMEDGDDISSSAITAMERLATDYTNRPHMARHEGLLVAVAKATEREAKLEGSSQSLPLLAKPLLMSLLVAM